MNCLLCEVPLIESLSYEINYTYTSYSHTLLINFVRRILNCDINSRHLSHLCKICHSVLEELDLAETNFLRLKQRIFERCNIHYYKTLYREASSQTDDNQPETIPNTEIPIEFAKEIKLEILEQPKPHEKTFECKICHKRFASKTGLILHTQRQHRQSIQQNTTTETSNEPASAVKLERDEEFTKPEPSNKEETVGEDDEETIDKTSSQSSDEESKPKTKSKKYFSNKFKPLKYVCPHCPKMWRSTGELRNHIATHSTIRPYICEMCGQAYKHKSALDIHVGMHNGINPFSCNYCNKAFTQKGALQRHLPIHTGEAPYQCDLCGKRFVHHTSFNMHTLAHTGQKSYKCNLCGLGLLSGSHLKRHMRVHTGERAYACAQCGKRFAERYNLAAHQRLHEASANDASRRLHKCQVCGLGFDRRPKLEEHLSNDHNKISDNEQNRKWMGHFLSNI